MPKELAELNEDSASKPSSLGDSDVVELWKTMPQMKGKEKDKATSEAEKLPSCDFFDAASMPKNGPSVELVQQAATEIADGHVQDTSTFDRLFDMKGFNSSVQDFVLQDNLNTVNDQLKEEGSAYRLQFGFNSDRSDGATTLDVYDNNSGHRVESNPFIIPNYEEFKCANGNPSPKLKEQTRSMISLAANEVTDGNIDASAVSQQLFPQLFDLSDVSQAKQSDRIADIEQALNETLREAQSDYRIRFGTNVIKTPGGSRLEVYDWRAGTTVDTLDFVIPDYKWR